MGPVVGDDDGVGFGVKGSSSAPHKGKGVEGLSPFGDGVFGQSEANHAAGVHGVHSTRQGVGGGFGGFGVFGETNIGLAAVKGQFGSPSGLGGAKINDSGVAGDSSDGPGVSGTSAGAEGVLGEGGTFGVRGLSTDGGGVFGESARGEGVHGLSHTLFAGVVGENASNERPQDDVNERYREILPDIGHSAGVFGTSLVGEGVHGETSGTRFIAGVAGLSVSPDGTGPGVAGESRGIGPGVFGESHGGGDGVIGKATWGAGVAGFHGDPHLQETVVASDGARAGVFGASENGAGVLGYARDRGSPAVWAVGGLWAAAQSNELAGLFMGDVQVDGDILLPGADCAEQFDVADAEAIEPGAVVVIDQDGRLRSSRDPYDSNVAGVVAGAGSFRSAIILDRGGTGDNRLPVALAGKVFCKVDAQFAPIVAGDLLTSSPTAGHAMKAADALRAFGAVIGKALQPCREGTGLIPILVCLG